MSGGKSKSQTVGYKYLVGMHIVVCEAPIDALLELSANDRSFWSGRKSVGGIAIDKPELFGGKKREGGVGGYVDVLDGNSEQAQNDYLTSQLTGLVPAFRGVFSLVFRQFYWGNNPYFQPLRIKVQSIYQTFGNWLPELAPVNGEENFQKVAINIAIDQSGSMTGTIQSTMKTAMNTFINRLPYRSDVAVRFQLWGGSAGSSQEWFGTSETTRDEMLAFIAALPATGTLGSTDADFATTGASSFFTSADSQLSNGDVGFQQINGALVSTEGLTGEASGNDPIRRVHVTVTDGVMTDADSAAATLNAIDRIELIGINIQETTTTETAKLDSDGVVPVVGITNTDELANAILFEFSSFADLNGVHILRDILINPANGGPGDASMIGTSWEPAAETAFREGLGFSFRWQNAGDVDNFKQQLERHLDCATWFDPVTNKYEIKLIRPDYTVGDLVTFGVGGIPVMEWGDPEFPDPAGLPNQVVVTYVRRDNGEKDSVTVTNVASVAASGIINSHKVTYEGVTFPQTAAKMAQRDLIAKSQSIVKGSFKATYVSPDQNLGSAIIVNEPRVGLNNMVVRITEIEEPDGKDNSVLIRFAEDVWAADLENDDAFVTDDTPDAVDTAGQPPNVQFAEELPYFELVRTFTEKEINEELGLDDGYAQWAASADQPNTLHQDGIIVTYDTVSTNWLQTAGTPLMPAWALNAALEADASSTTFTAASTGREDEIEVGDIIQINGEMMRVDSIAVASSVATFTVGRGVLDTVPARHGVGDYAFVWQDFTSSDFLPYTEGQTLDVKVLPQTSTSAADLDSVETQTITFAARADRPYPVGKFQLDGSYLPTGVQDGDLVGTWTHRDRLTQTYTDIDDHTADSIGPEADVAYIALEREVYLRQDLFAEVGSPVSPPGTADFFNSADFFLDDVRGYETEIALSPTQALTYTWNLTEPSPAWSDELMRMEYGVKTIRGVSVERESWQSPRIMVSPVLPPLGLVARVVDSGGGSGSGSGASGGSPATPMPTTFDSISGLNAPEAGWGMILRNPNYTGPACRVENAGSPGTAVDVDFDANGFVTDALPYGFNTRLITLYDQWGSDDLTCLYTDDIRLVANDATHNSWLIVLNPSDLDGLESANNANASPRPGWAPDYPVAALGLMRYANTSTTLKDVWGVPQSSNFMTIGLWTENGDFSSRVNGSSALTWSNTDWTTDSAEQQNNMMQIVQEFSASAAQGGNRMFLNKTARATFTGGGPMTYDAQVLSIGKGASTLVRDAESVRMSELHILEPTTTPARLTTAQADALADALGEVESANFTPGGSP